MNGAEALLRTLVAGGVTVCFANPGTSEMHIMDASQRVPAIRFVPCLSEGVVTGAADGYGRIAGNPGCTLLHLGPGLANGLANLHNARRGHAPIVNIVGEHPSTHRARVTPLASNIEAIARPFSDWVRTADRAASLVADAADAIAAARTPPGRIATLIVPADSAWADGIEPAPARSPPEPRPPSVTTVARAASMLRARVPTAMILAGNALHGRGLILAGRVREATGASLLTPFPVSRMERGAGRPVVDRIPYVLEDAVTTLRAFRQFILVGTPTPYAYFAYPDQDAVLVPQVSETLALAPADGDAAVALEALASALPTASELGSERTQARPSLPSGAINPLGLASVIAAVLPDQAIVVDEAMTSGRSIMAACAEAAPHDWLGNTGGSIGIGMPLAVGAAIACADRPVLCLSADGSGMYTLQALWTMARENLRITVVVFANRAYALLKHEHARIAGGDRASPILAMFDLKRPDLDWVSLARGMGVSATRVDRLDGFASALRAGLHGRAPNLIEVPL
ncbi:MAG TPA: acetolactate synthase large subunit [Stellaceae bacterium]|nr:acetolactate synthase large subunit [Stellaceae bacterium]